MDPLKNSKLIFFLSKGICSQLNELLLLDYYLYLKTKSPKECRVFYLFNLSIYFCFIIKPSITYGKFLLIKGNICTHIIYRQKLNFPYQSIKLNYERNIN